MNGTGAAVRAQGAQLLQSGALQVIDRLPRHEMLGYLALADVVVSPRSYGGNLPLKVFDYLAAGRPIVATDIPTHRAVLTRRTAVLVEPAAAALAQGIVSILRSPSKGRELAQAAQQYAFEHLGWNRFVRSVGEIYEDAHIRTEPRLESAGYAKALDWFSSAVKTETE